MVALLMVCASVACAGPGEPPALPQYELLAEQSSAETFVGGMLQLEASLLKEGERVEEALVWTSENEAVATVSDGRVTGVSEGKTVVYAAHPQSDTKSERIAVSVYRTAESVQIADEEFLLYSGRNKADAEGVTFYNTASGVEFRIGGGTQAYATLRGSAAGLKVNVYVNGEDVPAKTVQLTAQAEEYLIADGLQAERLNRIELVKVNSADKGRVFFTGLRTDGNFVKRSDEARLKFEFYGDSLTCGYGVNALPGEEDSIANEDGTVTWAYRLARSYRAQAHMQCYSGISAVVPHWMNETMAQVYDQTAPLVDSSLWDFEKFVADVIFINLATNDSGAVQTDAARETFRAGYTQFLKDLRARNEGAKIVVICPNNHLRSQLTAAVAAAEDDRIYLYAMTLVSTGGFAGHPNAKQYETAYLSLRKWMEKQDICR